MDCSMEIFYWSDYACPYCYIGETNLKAALRELSPGALSKAQMVGVLRRIMAHKPL